MALGLTPEEVFVTYFSNAFEAVKEDHNNMVVNVTGGGAYGVNKDDCFYPMLSFHQLETYKTLTTNLSPIAQRPSEERRHVYAIKEHCIWLLTCVYNTIDECHLNFLSYLEERDDRETIVEKVTVAALIYRTLLRDGVAIAAQHHCFNLEDILENIGYDVFDDRDYHHFVSGFDDVAKCTREELVEKGLECRFSSIPN